MDCLDKLAAQVSFPVPEPLRPSQRNLRFRLNEAQRQALVVDYRNGTPTTQLTSRYQLSKGSVLEILADGGVEMRRQGLTETQTSEATRLYESGHSLAAIATKLNSAPTTVNRALTARGVRLRGRHERL